MLTKPQIFYTKDKLPSHAKRLDAYPGAVEEMFFVTHPQYKKEMPIAQRALKKYLQEVKPADVWIYYPWRNLAVRTVNEKDYFLLRTARNRDIITVEEQSKYRNFKVGILGMSIGSATLASLVATGGPQKIKIADFDTVEVTNLNRMQANLTEVGENKAHVAARRTWELDPFCELQVWDQEITKENIDDFLTKDYKLQAVVDALDTLDVKVLLRLKCRELGIPVIMATSNGDGVIIDVERYDLDRKTKIFRGVFGNLDYLDLEKFILKNNYKEWVKNAAKIVDNNIMQDSIKSSVSKLGKKISGVPQLGSTINVLGSVTSLFIRNISQNRHIKSERYLFNFNFNN